MTTKDWLRRASTQLQSRGIPSARLDVELLLAHALNKSREYLLAHPEAQLLGELLERRKRREPMAYILGSKEFYGREFEITPDVLVPRPESEMIIELLKELPLQPENVLIDIGSGSGALAITAKREFPFLTVVAADISPAALNIAMKNAAALDAKIIFEESDLLGSPRLPRADCMVANLPYIGKNWEVSPETKYEPEVALYADDDGFYFIKKLISQAPELLVRKGCLIIEADPRQHDLIGDYSKNNGFDLKKIKDFVIVLQKR